jgi:hypothetical protein
VSGSYSRPLLSSTDLISPCRILSWIARHPLLSLTDYQTLRRVGSLIVAPLRLSTYLILLAASFFSDRAPLAPASLQHQTERIDVPGLLFSPLFCCFCTELILRGRILSGIAPQPLLSPAQYRTFRRLWSVIPNAPTWRASHSRQLLLSSTYLIPPGSILSRIGHCPLLSPTEYPTH